MKLRIHEFLLPICVLLTPLMSLYISLIGRPRIAFDIFYNRYWIDDARSGFFATIIATIILSITVVLIFLRRPSEKIAIESLIPSAYLETLLALVVLSLIASYQSWGLFDCGKVLLFFAVCFSFRRGGVTQESFETTARFVFASYVIALTFPLVFWSISWTPCRDDKCNIAGILLNSFFQSENALSIYVLTSIVFLRNLKSARYKLVGYFLAITLSYLSGSRFGFAAVVILVVCILLRKDRILFIAPILFLSLSLFFFAFGTGQDLTGRGYIFNAIRELWIASPIFGIGSGGPQEIFERGLVLGYVPYNEQNQMAHMLAQFGLFPTALFLMITLYVCIKFGSQPQQSTNNLKAQISLPLLAASFAFVTEAPVSFSTANPSFWILAIIFARFPRTELEDYRTENSSKRIP